MKLSKTRLVRLLLFCSCMMLTYVFSWSQEVCKWNRLSSPNGLLSGQFNTTDSAHYLISDERLYRFDNSEVKWDLIIDSVTFRTDFWKDHIVTVFRGSDGDVKLNVSANGGVQWRKIGIDSLIDYLSDIHVIDSLIVVNDNHNGKLIYSDDLGHSWMEFVPRGKRGFKVWTDGHLYISSGDTLTVYSSKLELLNSIKLPTSDIVEMMALDSVLLVLSHDSLHRFRLNDSVWSARKVDYEFHRSNLYNNGDVLLLHTKGVHISTDQGHSWDTVFLPHHSGDIESVRYLNGSLLYVVSQQGVYLWENDFSLESSSGLSTSLIRDVSNFEKWIFVLTTSKAGYFDEELEYRALFHDKLLDNFNGFDKIHGNNEYAAISLLTSNNLMITSYNGRWDTVEVVYKRRVLSIDDMRVSGDDIIVLSDQHLFKYNIITKDVTSLGINTFVNSRFETSADFTYLHSPDGVYRSRDLRVWELLSGDNEIQILKACHDVLFGIGRDSMTNGVHLFMYEEGNGWKEVRNNLPFLLFDDVYLEIDNVQFFKSSSIIFTIWSDFGIFAYSDANETWDWLCKSPNSKLLASTSSHKIACGLGCDLLDNGLMSSNTIITSGQNNLEFRASPNLISSDVLTNISVSPLNPKFLWVSSMTGEMIQYSRGSREIDVLFKCPGMYIIGAAFNDGSQAYSRLVVH